jgi:broad specificity phosphatase PhoE
MALVLIARHGESAWNAEGRIQGQTDTPLSQRGHAQADALARRLAAAPIDAIYTSDLSRARLTGERSAAAQRDLAGRPAPPVHPRLALRERNYGSWEGLTVQEVEALHGRSGSNTPDAVAALNLWEGPPDAETFEMVVQRVLGAWQEVALDLANGRTVLIVGHGAALRALMCGLTDTPVSQHRRWTLANAAFGCLRWERGAVEVEQWNECGHLAGC